MRTVVALLVLVAACFTAAGMAQDDPNDVPLGDVARKFRKMVPAPKQVIDDDNLSTVVEQAETRRAAGWPVRSQMAGEINDFRPPAPDVTCSLAFSMNAKTLFSTQYAQMDLPAAEVVKLSGPASVVGDALSVSVLNGTHWHVSEVSVAFTVVRKATAEVESQPEQSQTQTRSAAQLQDAPVMDVLTSPRMLPQVAVTPEKKPDLTVIYRMRAASPPNSTTVFTAPLNLDLAADEEWHWAIVEARGYPPQEYLERAAGANLSPDASLAAQATK